MLPTRPSKTAFWCKTRHLAGEFVLLSPSVVVSWGHFTGGYS